MVRLQLLSRNSTLRLLRRILLARPSLAAIVLLVGSASLLLAGPAHAQSAKTWNSRGQAAELREDYDAAYNDYRQALLKKPGDLRYKERVERLRFQAAVFHVDRGRVLRANGDLAGAEGEFQHALEIDPGNQTAAQELQIVRNSMQPASTGPSAAASPSSSNSSPSTEITPGGPTPEQAQLSTVTGPITLQPVSADPITLHMVEDTRVIYQAIGKAAGLNVLFDPNYTSKRIPIDLTNVSLSDALRIVGTVAGTFYKPVTPNTIFVAANTRQNRTDLDELAVQTFYLTNASQQNDANEILTAIRNLLDPSVKIYLVPSQNAIVMRATPDQLLLAQKLLADLDRARPEVVVDVAVLEVNRDKVRNLGITLPTSIGLTPTVSNNSSTSSTSSTSTTTTNSDGTTSNTPGTSNLNLSNLTNLNSNNIAVSISGGTVNALLTDADTRILQNPRIRATDGQKATLKIGSKIPIATGSYSSTLTSTAGLGVQTQFTYLDIGVNIDMTPTVHYDHEITLKMKIEVSSHTGDVTISNVTEPIISQRTVEHTIELKEGEPSILAGILTRSESLGVSGTPGLGEIPFLKYFFSSQSKEKQQDEVVFLLIPHIVRESVLTRMNTRPIDTGTGQSIELRHEPTAADLNVPVLPTRRQPTGDISAANAANAIIGQMAQQAQMPTPGNPAPGFNPTTGAAQATPTPNTAGGTPVTLSISPSTSTQTVGSTFQIAVDAMNAHDLYALPLQLQFNNKLLQLVNVDSGTLLTRDGQAVATVHRDESDGVVNISTSRPPGVKGVDGQGSVCILTFKAIAPGEATIGLPRVGARNSAQTNLPVVGSSATVLVK